MTLTAREIAEIAGGRALGDAAVAVSRAASADAAGPTDVIFVEDPKALPAALSSSAGIVIAGAFAAGASRESGALIVCEQPKLAFARILRRLYHAARPAPGVHPSAIIDPTAVLGCDVSIAPHAVVDADVRLGDRVVVGPGVHINAGVAIGDDTDIKSNVTIYSGTSLGARVVVHAGSVLGSDGFGYVRDATTGRYESFPQVGRLVVEDDVEIGAACTIDRGALSETRIGRGTKLDNQVHLAHNVSVGEDVVISAQTGVAGSSVIESRAIVAGQVGIADHVRIESGAILGAQCGVPSGKVIRGSGVLFWGTPARPIRQYLRELAVLARLAKK
jgi:UDP-3-O-[3-hydroxymyristoyl] glucosamine N-acyltransferase